MRQTATRHAHKGISTDELGLTAASRSIVGSRGLSAVDLHDGAFDEAARVAREGKADEPHGLVGREVRLGVGLRLQRQDVASRHAVRRAFLQRDDPGIPR